MKVIYRQLIVLMLIASILQACGFRLRGASELPSTIESAVIDGVARYSEVGLAIKQQLESSGAKVLASPDVDSLHFVVLKNDFFKRVLSVDSSGRANEYQLTYQFSMRVLDGKGSLLVTERLIRLNRNYLYDINNALAKSDEEESIKQQMIALAIRQAMRRVGIKLRQFDALNSGKEKLTNTDKQDVKPDNSKQPAATAAEP